MTVETLRTKARKLIAAANELLTVAHDLERWDIAPDHDDLSSVDSFFARQDTPHMVEMARDVYQSRRRRAEVFDDTGLFGEPAWDILLDLFIAAKDRKRLPVTSACIGAAVPSTTALRWLTVLEEKGLVVREHDTGDARRIFVRLSVDGYDKMVRFFNGFAGLSNDDPDNTETIARPYLRVAR